MKRLAILMVKGYQIIISPFLRPSCRFYPSCSQYAILALEKYGFIKGSLVAFKRILRCNPFHPGGYDPV